MKKFLKQNVLKSFKTTLLGLATIAITLLSSKGKIDAGTATAIISGIGLIGAKDHNSKDEEKTIKEENKEEK